MKHKGLDNIIEDIKDLQRYIDSNLGDTDPEIDCESMQEYLEIVKEDYPLLHSHIKLVQIIKNLTKLIKTK